MISLPFPFLPFNDNARLRFPASVLGKTTFPPSPSSLEAIDALRIDRKASRTSPFLAESESLLHVYAGTEISGTARTDCTKRNFELRRPCDHNLSENQRRPFQRSGRSSDQTRVPPSRPKSQKLYAVFQGCALPFCHPGAEISFAFRGLKG